MKSTLSRFKTAFIVVDALDECSFDERETLVKFLLDQINQPEVPGSCSVKIFLTSRDEDDLRRMFKEGNIRSYVIDANDTEKDIRPFVESEVASNIESGKFLGGNVPKELQKEVVTNLVKNADGMCVIYSNSLSI